MPFTVFTRYARVIVRASIFTALVITAIALKRYVGADAAGSTAVHTFWEKWVSIIFTMMMIALIILVVIRRMTNPSELRNRSESIEEI